MTRAAFAGTGRVNVRDAELPNVEDGGIIVRMRVCGICGSDLEKVYGRYAKPSMRLGHEPAGTVESVGSAVKGIAVGDRVFTHHHVSCKSCAHCARGEDTICDLYSISNISPCGLAELYAVPAHNVEHGGVLVLPDSVTFEEAAMIEPLACCIRAWRNVPCEKGDTVAVLGCGPTGIMHTMIARQRGMNVVCTDTNKFRLDFAQDIGAEAVHAKIGVESVYSLTHDKGADAVIVATGSVRAIQDAISMTRRGGTVMIFGVPPKDAALEINVGDLYARSISIRSSYAASDDDTREALGMIQNGLDVKRLVTHRYALEKTNNAFERAHSGEGAMKVVITSD